MIAKKAESKLIERIVATSRKALVGVGVFSMVINILMLTGPLFMLQIYDRVLTSHSVPTLLAFSVLVVTLYGFLGILEFIRQRVLVRIGHRFDEQAGQTAFETYIEAPLIAGPRGEVVQPIRDIDQVRQFFSGPAITALFDMPWMPVYLSLIFIFHPVLGLVALGGALFLFAIALATDFSTRKALAEANKMTGKRLTFAEAGRRNAEVVRGMGMRGALAKVWGEVNDGYVRAYSNAVDRTSGYSVVTKVFRLFLQSLILAVGAWLAILNEITPGTMIAASIIMTRALQPIEQAVTNWRGLIQGRQAFRRLKQTLTILPDAERTRLEPPRERVTVENLAVVPPGAQKPTVANVGFELRAGTALGVIGPSGSGKSTLARALVGVWPPARGSVRLDGAPFDQWREDDIGRNIGYLPQDVELFAGTVADNISRFDPERTSEAVIAASRLAGLHDLVVRLPEGYDTEVGEGAAVLSAGQRQRLALARALYRDPFLVVLDEPNSNLDGDGEAALTHAIRTVKERSGIVVIVAHRAGAVVAVDRLLVIEEGQQTAIGPRDEILGKIMKQRPQVGAQPAQGQEASQGAGSSQQGNG
ncbi:PrtD family type I secretion system ABC transporter [Rhodobium orientis]|uniref:Type I secretion system permease/ATPase n=1 Tax=Rhodobium orientis TaxID=34017 RepID=A0A327JGJ4_9HYPH|nr:type I secretion system permease/ATPase [Rhodobium orientis]MBB4304240.1 PrtD family type I secretion system ABC transporter [Rhodobium orientis]MBK5950709.1 type I secretion system permease/ATPase [Rhodobium orientis]RAI23994.1 type I secretion system permease/ATPase [Rhodobium orientis]